MIARLKAYLPLVILVGLGGIYVAFGPQLVGMIGMKKDPLETYALRIMETCKEAPYAPSCYDVEIPKLMDEGLSMEEAFRVTSLIQAKTNGYFYCHVLGHNLSAKETAKDPSSWTDVIGRCPPGMCSNGCLHGAAQERFRAEYLTPEQIEDVLPQLADICDMGGTRNYTGLEQASCYHSLGHLTMYLTNGKIDAATTICDRIANKDGRDYRQTCYEGSYMQIFQPLEPEDFGLVRAIAPTTTNEAETFCKRYEGERRAACHRESWPLYRSTLTEPESLTRFCALMPGEAHTVRCYNAMFYVLAAQLTFDESRIVPLCTGLSDPWRGQCFANSASRFIETDYRLIPSAVALCKTAEKEGVGNRCYDELLFYSTFNFHQGSPEFGALCKALPEPWHTKCMNGEGGQRHPNNTYVAD